MLWTLCYFIVCYVPVACRCAVDRIANFPVSNKPVLNTLGTEFWICYGFVSQKWTRVRWNVSWIWTNNVIYHCGTCVCRIGVLFCFRRNFFSESTRRNLNLSVWAIICKLLWPYQTWGYFSIVWPQLFKSVTYLKSLRHHQCHVRRRPLSALSQPFMLKFYRHHRHTLTWHKFL